MGELEIESELINKAKNGDMSALSDLMHRHYAFLFKYLIKITFQPHLAEDLAQETMLRCMEKIKLYNGKSKFSTWLITIATRLHIDHVRRKKRELHLQEQEAAIRKLRWEAERQNEDWPEMLQGLWELGEEARIPIILKHYYGYSLEEIGLMLDIPVGTVKSRIHYGVKRLRKELEIDARG